MSTVITTIVMVAVAAVVVLVVFRDSFPARRPRLPMRQPRRQLWRTKINSMPP